MRIAHICAGFACVQLPCIRSSACALGGRLLCGQESSFPEAEAVGVGCHASVCLTSTWKAGNWGTHRGPLQTLPTSYTICHLSSGPGGGPIHFGSGETSKHFSFCVGFREIFETTKAFFTMDLSTNSDKVGIGGPTFLPLGTHALLPIGVATYQPYYVLFQSVAALKLA